MLIPGDEKVIADRLYAVLSKPPKFEDPVVPQGEPVAVAGVWDAHLEFGRGSAKHSIQLQQDGAKLEGQYVTDIFGSSPLRGTVAANTVRFQTSFQIQGQRLSYTLTGTVDGDKMAGVVNMGEYGETSWIAERNRH
jgi:hypothetical protein